MEKIDLSKKFFLQFNPGETPVCVESIPVGGLLGLPGFSHEKADAMELAISVNATVMVSTLFLA